MFTHVTAISNLQRYAQQRTMTEVHQIIPAASLEEALAHGWVKEKKLNKGLIKIKKEKSHGIRCADRIWLFLYKMNFHMMSNDYTTKLRPEISTSFGNRSLDIDIVCLDGEMGLGIFLKMSPQPRPSDSSFLQDLQMYEKAIPAFLHSMGQIKPVSLYSIMKVAFIIFTINIEISDNERKLAQVKHIRLLGEHDLMHYEALVERLGSAAKYHFLAEIFDEKDVPAGLFNSLNNGEENERKDQSLLQ